MCRHCGSFLILFGIAICTYFNIVKSFSLEELKWVNYEIDISKNPVRVGEAQVHPIIHMKSKYGQEYQCILPETGSDLSEKETEQEKTTDIKELLKPLQTGSCLLKSKDWWTYELCYGRYIKQFHIEDGQIVGQVITLGLFESDYDWTNETAQERIKNLKLRFHPQFYTNGTPCDLTGQPRNAEVRLYCEEDVGDYIYRVDEPGTCSYVIAVHTSRLCSHPYMKPLPTNKAYSIPCSPLLSEDQYSRYLAKLNEEKLNEGKKNQWPNVQQDRLQVIKNWAKESYSYVEDQDAKQTTLTENEVNNDNIARNEEIKDKGLKDTLKNQGEEETLEKQLMQEYDKEMERLKAAIPPEKFAVVKNDIQKQFNSILNKAEDKLDEDNGEKDVAFTKFTSTLNALLDKLDKAEKEVIKATKELKKAKSEEPGNKIIDKIKDNLEKDSTIEEKFKVTEDEDNQLAILEDDKLHLRIRRLDRKSVDSNGKMQEMDFVQRKRLEQAVKEKLEKAGLDTGGRRIEVKIITAGYYDNEEGKDFQSLTEEENSQFQNMIMALLIGQQEAVQEMERHKKLEESYKFIWDDEQQNEEDKM